MAFMSGISVITLEMLNDLSMPNGHFVKTKHILLKPLSMAPVFVSFVLQHMSYLLCMFTKPNVTDLTSLMSTDTTFYRPIPILSR